MAYFFSAFLLSVLLTFIVRKLAIRLNVMDIPDGGRKAHSGKVPLLGGAAIFFAFWAVIFYLFFYPTAGVELLQEKLLAAFFASLVIMVIGFIDDARPLPAKIRFLITALAIGAAVLFTPWLGKITNPLGGVLELGLVFGNVLAFFWLLGMTYTTKILDGLDGLATGIAAIGALMIYFLSSSQKYHQPNVALLALILAGVLFGFLLFNFHPAKIFLGESGSLLVGFLLAVLAIIAGGKIATALLVLAIPILDLARVVYLRLARGQPISQGDREHLHFRLLDMGMSQRRAVLLLYGVALAFGLSTLFLQSYQKLIALLFLVVAMGVAGVWLRRRSPPLYKGRDREG
ncbi:undecaprenyl/decaprenyl-phosphate alpha-N-acetylglucosaminyl 1-phosphate transferase [Patescibacteria group bacterium]|nr:MAG: undecaprenyl/decaprenyl-phosphate alpha-N-acetylglucosaminyl 1-phosphate transferase [Patescibacteria group bacterium]